MTLEEGEQSREFFVKKETEELESTSFAVMHTWDQQLVCILFERTASSPYRPFSLSVKWEEQSYCTYGALRAFLNKW